MNKYEAARKELELFFAAAGDSLNELTAIGAQAAPLARRDKLAYEALLAANSALYHLRGQQVCRDALGRSMAISTDGYRRMIRTILELLEAQGT